MDDMDHISTIIYLLICSIIYFIYFKSDIWFRFLFSNKNPVNLHSSDYTGGLIYKQNKT